MEDPSHAYIALLLTSPLHCITKSVMHGKQVSYSCNCYFSRKFLPEISLTQNKPEAETGYLESKQLVTLENIYLLRFHPTLPPGLKYTMHAERSAAWKITRQHSQELKNTSSHSKQIDRFPSKPTPSFRQNPACAISCVNQEVCSLMGQKSLKRRDLKGKATRARNMPSLQPISERGISLDNDMFRSCRIPFSNPSSPYQLPPEYSSAASPEAAQDCAGLSTACASQPCRTEVHPHGSSPGCALPFPQLAAGWFSPRPSRI